MCASVLRHDDSCTKEKLAKINQNLKDILGRRGSACAALQPPILEKLKGAAVFQGWDES